MCQALAMESWRKQLGDELGRKSGNGFSEEVTLELKQV